MRRNQISWLLCSIWIAAIIPVTALAEEYVCDTIAECIADDKECDPTTIEIMKLNIVKNGKTLIMISPENDEFVLNLINQNTNTRSFLLSSDNAMGYLTLHDDGLMIFTAHRIIEASEVPYTISAYGYCEGMPIL